MATVPYDQRVSAEPFPTVTPKEGLPDDYEHIQASPDMFGALVAQAKERVAAQTGASAQLVGQSLRDYYGSQGAIAQSQAAIAQSQEEEAKAKGVAAEGMKAVAASTGALGEAQVKVAGAEDALGKSRTAIGEGAQKLGTDLSQVGVFYGQVAADDATNTFMDQANKLLYGDSTKMVKDDQGNMVPDTGYFGLKGKAALDARPQVEEKLGELMDNARGGLMTGQQQLQFDENTRRQRIDMANRIGEHGNQQAMAWYGEVNKATAQQAVDGITTHYDDKKLVFQYTAQLMSAYVKQAMLLGGGDDLVSAATAAAHRDATKAEALAMSVRDPLGADQWLDRPENRQALGSEYVTLKANLRVRADNVRVDNLVNGSLENAQRQYGTTGVYDGGPISNGLVNEATAQSVSPSLALTAGRIESKLGTIPDAPGSQYKGVLQLGDEEWEKNGGGDRNNVGLQLHHGVAQLAQVRDDLRQQLGREPEDWEVYLGHQQGVAGAIALMNGEDQKASDVLSRFHDGDPVKKITGNQGAADMTAAQFVDLWKDKYQHFAQEVAPLLSQQPVTATATKRSDLPSYPEYARAHFEDIVDSAVHQAQASGMDAEAVERVRSKVSGQLSSQITRLEKAFAVDTDTVTRAINDSVTKGIAPASLEDMAKDNPKLGAVINRINWQQPKAIQTLRSAISAAQNDLRDKETGPGPGFYKLLQQIHPADGSPPTLTDVNALNAHLQPGPDHITYQGFQQLRSEILGRKGESEGDQTLRINFISMAKKQLSGEDPLTHIRDPKGEVLFQTFLGHFSNDYDKARAAGKTVSQLLTPDSPDYLGKSIDQYKRKPAVYLWDVIAASKNEFGDAGSPRPDASMQAPTAPATSGAPPKPAASAPVPELEQTESAADLAAIVQQNPNLRAQAIQLAIKRGWVHPPQGYQAP